MAAPRSYRVRGPFLAQNPAFPLRRGSAFHDMPSPAVTARRDEAALRQDTSNPSIGRLGRFPGRTLAGFAFRSAPRRAQHPAENTLRRLLESLRLWKNPRRDKRSDGGTKVPAGVAARLPHLRETPAPTKWRREPSAPNCMVGRDKVHPPSPLRQSRGSLSPDSDSIVPYCLARVQSLRGGIDGPARARVEFQSSFHFSLFVQPSAGTSAMSRADRGQ